MWRPSASSGAAALEGASKLVVLLSAFAALVVEGVLASHGWPGMLQYALAACAAVFALTWWRPAAGWAIVAAALYFSPALVLAISGRHVNADDVVWMGACFGAVAATGHPLKWSVPERWKWALAYWALAVALVWPLIVWREVDFDWSLLGKYTPYRLANSGLGGTPAVITLWIGYVTMTHLLGLLFFDAMWRRFQSADRERFLRGIAMPAGVAAAAACAVAVYQGNVDINFLNGHQWPALRRAAGTLVDGDAFGVLAAMWTMGFLAIASRVSGWRVAAALVAHVLGWGAVWATGSRSALAVLVGSALLTGLFAAIQWRRGGVRLPLKPLLAGAAIVIVAIVAIAQTSSANSPIRRLGAMREAAVGKSVQQVAVDELWNRHAPFGTVSMMMIRQHPTTGVGIGSFHHLFPDVAYSLTGWNRYFFDNAQSWYRHHVAELGLLGGAGLIIWVASFLWILVRAGAERSIDAAALKTALVAMGLISAVTMPAQNLAVSFSFWLFAMWYLQTSEATAARLEADRWPRVGLAWAVVWAGALIFAAATFEEGLMELRPAYRAVAADWNYSYGFEGLDESSGRPMRWTSAKRAVHVMNVEARQWVMVNGQLLPPPPGTPTPNWARITVTGGPPDAASSPFRLRLIVDRKLLADYAFYDGKPRTWYVQLQPGQRYMMVEIRTGKLWSPAAYGTSPDTRSLGVALMTPDFVVAPPPGAEIFPLDPR